MTTLTATRATPLLRRIGKATFAFFFIKGLLWLAAPFVFLWIT